MEYNGINLTWLGHDSFKIRNGKTIYIDPYQLSSDAEKADIIFITHEHFDHCSVEDLKLISTPETIIIAPPDCQNKMSKIDCKDIMTVEPGQTFRIGEIEVTTVPAYNTNKKFHPKENNWLGYVINIGGTRIYHAGDTDKIPEMNELKDIDIALLPVSGTYVMTASEAAEAANVINPKLAIPMHYNSIVGSEADAQKFKELCDCEVKILEEG
ncbi:MBL fold metallo-hydrolase [Candidatus Woesearchaeota archaeon]|nr:MAG: MBL fold metallo-hydrolase [Candidatus Woesearchaeota archaeon]